MLGMTVVSLLPHRLKETKPGLRPEEYIIEAAEKGDISILTITKATCAYLVPMKKDPLILDKLPEEVANAVVNDYVKSALCKNEEINAGPGLFCVEGVFTKEEVKKKFADKIKYYAERQNRWFLELVRMADNDYGRTKQPKVVSDLQRSAAKQLGFKREWQLDESHIMTNCPACLEIVNPAAVICAKCGYVIDKVRHKEMFPDQYKELATAGK